MRPDSVNAIGPPASRAGSRLSGEHPKPRRGEDVTAILTVRRRTAELGGSAAVKLPTGRKCEGAIPAGVKDGAPIRLRGLDCHVLRAANRGTPSKHSRLGRTMRQPQV